MIILFFDMSYHFYLKPTESFSLYTKKLVEKLNYFNINGIDVSFVINGDSILNSSFAIISILKYIKEYVRKDLLYGYTNHPKVICYVDVN